MYVGTMLHNSVTSESTRTYARKKLKRDMWKPCCIRAPVVAVDLDLCVTFS
jgi:hypothetical protein